MRIKNFYWLVFILFLRAEIYPQWVQTSGPYGGSINSLVVSGTNLFAGTGGFLRGCYNVFLSTNNGKNWKAVNSGLPGNFGEWEISLAISADGMNLFAGFGPVGVFHSTDNGLSWTEATGLNDIYYIHAFAVNGSNIFAGGSGVFLSTDNGTSWTPAGLADKSVNALVATPDGTNLFAGGAFGEIFRSTDNGTSWSAVGLGSNIREVEALTVIPDGLGGINLFAGTWDGLFHSTNYGTSWTKVSSGLPTNLSVSCFAVDGSNLYLGAANAGLYGKGSVFRSTNNGTSWTSVGLENKNVRALANNHNSAGGTNLFAGDFDGTGIFLSTDNGTTWKEVNNGLTSIVISSLTVFPTEEGIPYLFAGNWLKGIFLSTNNGTDWSEINTEYPWVTSFAIRDKNIFAGTGSGVIRSTNYGNSWTEVNSGLPWNPHINALATSGTNLFASVSGYPNGSVYLSTNNGANWTEVSSGLSPNLNFNTFAVIGTNIFVGASGSFGTSGGVFLSTNNGSSWVGVNSGLPNVPVNSLVVSGINIFASTGLGIYRSTDIGTSWTKADTGLPPNAAIDAFAVSGTNIFTAIHSYSIDAIVTSGFYLSTNNGDSWSPVNSGLPNVQVNSLAISSTYLFAGTYGASVWRRPLSEMITEVECSTELPTEFALYQNYPNPFNPKTTIKYSIPTENPLPGGARGGFVTLKIYDVLGNEVSTLVNEEKPAGTYEVTWNAENLSSGVYFYQLKAGNYVETKKMILLR